MPNASLQPADSGHYDADYFAFQAPIGEFGGWANLSKFQPYIGPADAVLDFGCGGGSLLKNLKCGSRAGIEVNPVARRAAQVHGFQVFAHADEAPDQWADVLISNNALEHTQHPLSELQRLLPKLKPGGRVIFVVPCEAPSYAYRPGDVNHHLYSWSPMCIGNLFTEAGYEVLDSRPYRHKWPPNYQRWARLGRRVFDGICRLYARWERSWVQVRVIAQRPKEGLPIGSHLPSRLVREIIDRVQPFTMTSPERIEAVCQSVAHLEAKQIPGAIVECGVWKGGSMMAAAITLLHLGNNRRDLYLFDTFTGMTPPSAMDRDHTGRYAGDVMADETAEAELVRAKCSLTKVRAALLGTGYDPERVHFVAGPVEETLPAAAPDVIALLRLDTDWYTSTSHELACLFPRLAPGGVLIVDDYGHWQGARQAVDEYFNGRHKPWKLHEIDYTGRLLLAD